MDDSRLDALGQMIVATLPGVATAIPCRSVN